MHVGRPRVHTSTDNVGMYEKDGTSTPINSGGNRRKLARYKKMTPLPNNSLDKDWDGRTGSTSRCS